jgi:hypothetical protein
MKTILIVGAALLAAPGAMAQASAHQTPLQWSVPPVLPRGALIAIVAGQQLVEG